MITDTIFWSNIHYSQVNKHLEVSLGSSFLSDRLISKVKNCTAIVSKVQSTLNNLWTFCLNYILTVWQMRRDGVGSLKNCLNSTWTPVWLLMDVAILSPGWLVWQEAWVSKRSVAPTWCLADPQWSSTHGVIKTGSAVKRISSSPTRIVSFSFTSYEPTELCNALDAGKLMTWV